MPRCFLCVLLYQLLFYVTFDPCSRERFSRRARQQYSMTAAIPLIQVTNVAPLTTDQQMKELFSYLGSINEIKVYPERYIRMPVV